MPIELQARLLGEFGERILFKPEATPIGPRLTALLEATGGRARIFEGSGGIALVESHARGIAGTMPGAEMIDGIVALWRALEAGDRATVDRIFPLICVLVSMQTGLDGFLAIEKYLLVKQDIFCNARVRGPVSYQLDQQTRSQVDYWFARLQESL
jgi:4-hydroxy-tetrahydrodipicolinate synthase